MLTVAIAISVGLAAGVLAGLFGVGGGIVYVPVLTLALGLSQLDAEATSLLAIIPTVATGVWRQRAYGNVRWRPSVIMGVCAVAGVQAGVVIAESLPENVLRRLFGVLVITVGAQIAWRARKTDLSSKP